MSAYDEIIDRVNGDVQLTEPPGGGAQLTVNATFMTDGDAIVSNKYAAGSKKYVDVSVTNSDNDQNGFHALAPGQRLSVIKKWSTKHPGAVASIVIREQTAGDNPPPPSPKDEKIAATQYYEYVGAAVVLICVAIIIYYLATRR